MTPPKTKLRIVPAVPRRRVYYDRHNFSELFDGEVDRGQSTVTLILSLAFSPVGWGMVPPDGVLMIVQKFKAEMKKVVEKEWSGQYRLQCLSDTFRPYTAKVAVVVDGTYLMRSCPAHTDVAFYPSTDERSCAGRGEAILHDGDNDPRDHPREVFPDAKNKVKKKYVFKRTTSAHEFGHMMGLDHIAGKGNEETDYGMTYALARDIMGSGSLVSERDYEPFLHIMRRYGEDYLPQDLNHWKLVTKE